ncbi:MAG: hypothetical protein ACREKI_08600 [Gemmatimonadota bacterium]
MAVILASWAAAACSGAPADDPMPRPAEAQESTLPPVGYGTLRQDAFTVQLRIGDLQIKMTPLAEEVIRLAAPDTYERLRELAQTHAVWGRRTASAAGLRDAPLLFLVSFFTFAPQSEYTPTDLQVQSEGRLYRALASTPVTPGFGTQLLRQEETQIAVYAYDPEIDLSIPMVVRYGTVTSGAWESIVSTLEAERGRVLSRTKAETR